MWNHAKMMELRWSEVYSGPGASGRAGVWVKGESGYMVLEYRVGKHWRKFDSSDVDGYRKWGEWEAVGLGE